MASKSTKPRAIKSSTSREKRYVEVLPMSFPNDTAAQPQQRGISDEIRDIAEKLIRDGLGSDGIGASSDGVVAMALIRARIIYQSLRKLKGMSSSEIVGLDNKIS